MAKLRIGLIGAGGRGCGLGGRLVKYCSDAAELVAFADLNAVRARAAMEEVGIAAEIHEDAEELCKRKDIHAVIVTSPDYLHAEHAVLAFRHKKHVFVDKPLATTVEGCLEILEASLKAGKLLYMGFNLRHQKVIRKLKEMADAKMFGEIFSIRAVEHYMGGRTYLARWNRLKKYSGGLWVHKGSHDFDVINHLMGKVRPARVSCFANVSVFKPDRLPFKLRGKVKPGPACDVCAYKNECMDACFRHQPGSSLFTEETAKVDGYHRDLCIYLSDKDTHDQGIAIIEYENGATAAHCEYFGTPIGDRQYAIEGTGGHCDADMYNHEIKFRPRWSGDDIHYKLKPEPGAHGGADPIMIRNFIECMKRGKRPLAAGVDGAWSVAMGVAAEISREEKRVVELSDLMDTKSKLLGQGR